MSTKTVLKVLEKSIELAILLIELKKEEKQFKGVPPIPDYKKGAKKGIMIVNDGQSNNKESIVLPNGEEITLSDRAKKVFNQTENHFSDSLGYALNSPEVREKLFQGSIKYWNDVLKGNYGNGNKESLYSPENIKKAFDFWNEKAEQIHPFAHPIENKESKLEVGKWHKWIDGDITVLWFITKIENETIYAYGFLNGEWTNDGIAYSKAHYKEACEELKPAVKDEVLVFLEKEALKRGFTFMNFHSTTNGPKGEIKQIKETPERFGFCENQNKLLVNNWSIFENGVWAEVFKPISKKEAEKQLCKIIID